MKSDILVEEALLIPAVPIYSKRQSQGSLPGSGLCFQSEMNSKQATNGHKYLFDSIWGFQKHCSKSPIFQAKLCVLNILVYKLPESRGSFHFYILV